jgi:hypothetical protein
MYVWRKVEAHSRNHCCCAKNNQSACARVDTWVCSCACVFVALLIQHATRIPIVAFRNLRTGLKILNIKCVFWFFLQLSSETILILTIIQRTVHLLCCLLRVVKASDCATDWPVFRRSPTGCVCARARVCACVCDQETSTVMRPRPELGCSDAKKSFSTFDNYIWSQRLC